MHNEENAMDENQVNKYKTLDPWANRAVGMTCQTCIWYVEKVRPDYPRGAPSMIGRCRKHAPTMGGFPVVYPADWCGDHRIDEVKL